MIYMEPVSISCVEFRGLGGAREHRCIALRCHANAVCSSSRPLAFGSQCSLGPKVIECYSKQTAKQSIFSQTGAPVCQFLHLSNSRVGRRIFRTSKRRKHIKRAEFRNAATPLATNDDQEDDRHSQNSDREGELGSTGFPRTAPSGSEPSLKSLKGPSFMKSAFTRGSFEREILQKEILSRLGRPSVIPGRPSEQLTVTDSNQDISGNSLTWEDGKWLQPVGRGHREVVAKTELLPPHRKVDAEAATKQRRVILIPADSKQLGQDHCQNRKESRRSVLKQYIPAIILERLGGLQFHPMFADKQNRRRVSRVNMTVSYKMSYLLETDDGDLKAKELELEVKDHGATRDVPSKSPRKAGTFPRSLNFWTPPRDLASRNVSGAIQERTGFGHSTPGALRSGRSLDPNSLPIAVGARKPGVRMSRQTGRRRKLWPRPDAGAEPLAGNLWKDLLAIIGLVAFVISGTYAFALGHRSWKSAPGARKTSSVFLTNSVPETRAMATDFSQDLTDDNFEDFIQRRPTFVLFYAPWCPYCQQLDTTWKELALVLNRKGYNVQLGQLDAEKYTNIAREYQVDKYPTLLFFIEGLLMDTHLGPRNVDSLMRFIDDSLHRKH